MYNYTHRKIFAIKRQMEVYLLHCSTCVIRASWLFSSHETRSERTCTDERNSSEDCQEINNRKFYFKMAYAKA